MVMILGHIYLGDDFYMKSTLIVPLSFGENTAFFNRVGVCFVPDADARTAS